jgi:hypothetical protein
MGNILFGVMIVVSVGLIVLNFIGIIPDSINWKSPLTYLAILVAIVYLGLLVFVLLLKIPINPLSGHTSSFFSHADE